MKLILLLLPLLALAVAADLPTAARPITVRSRIPICRPRLVYRTAACLCNIAVNRGVLTPELAHECRALYKRGPRNLGHRCLTLRGDMITPRQVFTNAQIMLSTCFINVKRREFPPGSELPGERGGAPLKTILMWMNEVMEVMQLAVDILGSTFPTPKPSAAARIVVTGDHLKERRLTRFNNLAQV